MRKILLPIVALILALALALSMAVPALAQSASAWTGNRDDALGWGKWALPMAQSASVWTDKQDYAPEEVVTISGSGFLANAEVAVTVERPDGVTDTVAPAPATNDTGYFTCTYQLDGIEGTYTVTATDGTNTATTNFTDGCGWDVHISVTVSPTSVPADSTTSFTVNITVLPGFHHLPVGSVEISMGDVSGSDWGTPSSVNISGFDDAGDWTVHSNGTGLLKIQATGSGNEIDPGETMTVTFNVTAPSETGTSTWTVRGYQNTGFSGDWDRKTKDVQVTGPFAGYLYALRGDDEKDFWRYDIGNNTWEAMHDTPKDVEEGGALVYAGSYIYALRGNDKDYFWRYDIANDTWTAMHKTLADVEEGGALTFDSTYIYALRGDNKDDFWRYDIASDTWTAMNGTPSTVKAGGALTFDGTYIYALQGNQDGGKHFWRYDIANDTWTALNDTPESVNKGAALTYDGTYIYALRGQEKKDFWRYDIANDTWTTLNQTLGRVNQGGALTYYGSYIYALRGDDENDFWRYDIGNDTWTSRKDTLSNVGWGGALCAPLAAETLPLVNVNFPPPDGWNGWFITSPVNGTVNATDPSNVTAIHVTGAGLSGVTGLDTTNASGNLTVTGDGIHNIVATATNGAGNTGAAPGSNNTATVKIDTTPPTLTKALYGTEGENGWYTSDVIVNLTGYDATSGLNKIEYKLNGGGWTDYTGNFTISAEGCTTLYHRAYDNAGNVYVLTNQTIKIDKTPPTLEKALYGTPGLNDWYTSDVIVNLTAADDTSGINKVEYNLNGCGWTDYNGNFTISAEGTNALYHRAYDNAGNVYVLTNQTIKIDKTPPTLEKFLYGTMGLDDWYTSDVIVNLTGYDATSGLNRIEYKLNGGGWITYTANFTISAEGINALQHRAYDNAGNVFVLTNQTIKIDKTPPTLKKLLSGTLDNGVFTTNVTVNFTGYDATSGLNKIEYNLDDGGWTTFTGSFVISTDGIHTLQHRAYDNAGNVYVLPNQTITIDKTPTPPRPMPFRPSFNNHGRFGGARDILNLRWLGRAGF